MVQKRLIYLVVLLCMNICLALQDGFVYLDTIDSTIVTNLRYAGNDNFLGTVVTGYKKASRAVITTEAARALSKAQGIFKTLGYKIVVYDAYRPQSAVNHFIRWANDSSDQKNKELYYPRVDKSDVFQLGYVGKLSGHSRGSTVDISIIKISETIKPIQKKTRKLLDGFIIAYLDDGTLDMGSSFDLFDVASHITNDLISKDHKKNRQIVQDVMVKCGFKSYESEWWHFTLENEPFPGTYFDFPLV